MTASVSPPVQESTALHESTWQRSLQHAFRKVDELLHFLELDPAQVPECDSTSSFPMLVPREYAARMGKGDPRDPLLLQVLPVRDEQIIDEAFLADPVGDSASEVAPGLLHKYESRVLLITTGACAVHCRYCFRRHYPYDEKPKSWLQWQTALQSIERDSSIEEVILSGGDPLSLNNNRLRQLIEAIESIPHVQRLRVHTRFPLMIPNRIDDPLVEILGSSRLRTVLVWHINHAQEIDVAVATAARDLQQAGILQLNQAVLLRSVNDSLPDQIELSKRLIDVGILPYYLHQLDRVHGAMHFECRESLGIELVNAMREQLSGYAVPRYVREMPGELSKSLIR
jgi:EF-P beta-lysylation protein EpmB